MISIHESSGEDIRALNVTALEVATRTSGLGQNNDQIGMLKFRRAVSFLFVLLAWCSGLVSSRAGDVGPSEAQVKAAFLLNFPKYVTWPGTALSESNSPIVVGIIDDEEVASEFSTMSAGKVVDGHPIQLVRVTSIPQCRDCHILFIGSTATRKLPEILPSLQAVNVLAVGESDEFIDRGGMINLARRDRRIVIEVNLDAIHQTQLKISSKLMALATVKGGKK
jgi:hypothetical protein